METVFDKPLDSTITKITNVIDARIASNANNANEGGTWYFNPQTTNKPTSSGYYICFVLVRNANNFSQLAIEINSGRTFTRAFHDGTTWTSWSELDSITGQSAPVTYTSQSNITNYQNTLLGYLESMADSNMRIIETKSNWSGNSPTGGAWATTVLYRIESGVYKVNILDTCTNGYYYSSAWHWSRATMSSITF